MKIKVLNEATTALKVVGLTSPLNSDRVSYKGIVSEIIDKTLSGNVFPYIQNRISTQQGQGIVECQDFKPDPQGIINLWEPKPNILSNPSIDGEWKANVVLATRSRMSGKWNERLDWLTVYFRIEDLGDDCEVHLSLDSALTSAKDIELKFTEPWKNWRKVVSRCSSDFKKAIADWVPKFMKEINREAQESIVSPDRVDSKAVLSEVVDKAMVKDIFPFIQNAVGFQSDGLLKCEDFKLDRTGILDMWEPYPSIQKSPSISASWKANITPSSERKYLDTIEVYFNVNDDYDHATLRMMAKSSLMGLKQAVVEQEGDWKGWKNLVSRCTSEFKKNFSPWMEKCIRHIESVNPDMLDSQ